MYIVASRAGRARSDVMALKDWLVVEAAQDLAQDRAQDAALAAP
jgi:hypothetical protein